MQWTINLPLLYSSVLVGIVPAWLLLVFAPAWRFTQWSVNSIAIPALLGFTYAALIAEGLPMPGASLLDFANLLRLFATPSVALAIFVHLLLFNLFTGAWVVRDARRRGLAHLWVVPCLLLTFATGPLGLLLYFLLRIATRRGGWNIDESLPQP